ncbi:hypothetical protein SYJ56_07570 [Algoriphagus sp. D3-2-R+10]|uniref:hypothetical protein n=1 Tax=Algoriphagus aurantiacus TaxID=3103948 RepID=UPI002B3B8849|nr:hypothetical protein [Algoriphagus sp. D3-2-R+10]MEB2775161.1 hypothetical protein [Algoriphagus sp. D3-2-R+10]
MKNPLRYILPILVIISLGSCNKSDDPIPSTPDEGTLTISGNLDVIKKGTFTSQSGSNTKGMIALGSDVKGDFYVQLSNDFNSSFHTGTVTVYLSNSSNLTLTESSSFQLVAVVDEGGEHFFKLPSFPDAKFSHGILWCGAAAIPFGFAEFE